MKENTKIVGIGESVEIRTGRIAGVAVWWVYMVSPYGNPYEGISYATEAEAREDYARRCRFSAAYR